MDGLLGGIVLIAALMFFIVSLQTYQYVWSIITMGLIGSMVGYLFFNLPPAKIFMGDGGSFFLGFIVAELSIMGGWSTNAVKASIIPIIILLIPILDLTFVIIKRLVLRETTSLSSIIKHCAKDHLGHRLLKMGFGIKMSLVLIYFVCFNIGIGAVALRNSKSVEAIFMLIFCINVTLLSLLITFYLKRKDK
jgi:UDP-GlcNAc:undecaprenyl-phosphate GlcNAc-1-phosphate transferase